MISTKNVHLLAFVGNARSIVPTRTLNFGGACAKQFAKLELLVPTNNSTLHRIISDHRRTCVQLRHCPTQLPCASWSARGESFPQSGLDLQDTNDDGRRILSARVRHGLPLAMPTQLRNGSSASPCATAIRCACCTTVTHAWHEEKLSTTFQTTSKNNHQTFADPLLSKCTVDRNLQPNVCGRRHPHNQKGYPSRLPNSACVATPTRWLLSEHTCGSHDWRISQTFAPAKMLQGASPSKKVITAEILQ